MTLSTGSAMGSQPFSTTPNSTNTPYQKIKLCLESCIVTSIYGNWPIIFLAILLLKQKQQVKWLKIRLLPRKMQLSQLHSIEHNTEI